MGGISVFLNRSQYALPAAPALAQTAAAPWASRAGDASLVTPPPPPDFSCPKPNFPEPSTRLRPEVTA